MINKKEKDVSKVLTLFKIGFIY